MNTATGVIVDTGTSVVQIYGELFNPLTGLFEQRPPEYAVGEISLPFDDDDEDDGDVTL